MIQPRRFLARYIGLLLNDCLKSQNVARDLSFLHSSWKWDKSEIEKYQIRKLRQLLLTAGKTSFFYKNSFASAGFDPEKLRRLEDFRHVPPLERTDLVKLTAGISGIAKSSRKGTSSGTTGVPVTYYKDSNTLSMGKAAMYFGRMINGWRLGDRTANIWGNPKTVHTLWRRPSSRLNAFIQNELRIPACDLSNEHAMREALERIASKNIKYVTGYTNSLRALASIALSASIDVSCRRVFSTAETLFEEDRRLIETAFGPVTDMYGCGEINGIAFQCPGCGNYHTVDPHVLVEYELAADGMHSVLVTDLDNFCMPLIRYRIGDLVDIADRDKPCSSTHWGTFKAVRGRKSNIISINGLYLNPITYFGDSLGRLLTSIFQKHIPYQTTWDGTCFSLVLFVDQPLAKEKLHVLRVEMNSRLAEYNVPLSVRSSTKNPETSKTGKFSFFLNEVRKGE